MAPLAPIQQQIEALAVERGYPAEAVGACLRQREQSIPLLRALLQRAARGVSLTDAEAAQLFLGIHILAQLRDQASFLPLMRLLRRPTEDLEDLLGDTLTATLPRVVASLFDGDTDMLFDSIADVSIDEFVRESLWRAATFLAFRGTIEREVLVAFIIRFDDERLAPKGDMGWMGWLGAIAFLGLEDLAPRVAPVFNDGRLPADCLEPQDFAEDLAAARERPEDPERFKRADIGTIDDVAEALAWADWDGPPQPVVNPMRNVGRNDPCPCGSGKKAKKCCLASP